MDANTPRAAASPRAPPKYQRLQLTHLPSAGPEHGAPLCNIDALAQMKPYSRIDTISGTGLPSIAAAIE